MKRYTYARAYDPYGVVTTTSGSSYSAYGYTGEYTGDSTDLVYLRARYYASNAGRFLSKDTWSGDQSIPVTFNQWIYVRANPVNLIDPSGNNWQYPTKNEGRLIHDMIEADFLEWGFQTGRRVDKEVKINSASKEQSPYVQTPTGRIYRPIPDNDDPNPNEGRADMLEFGSPGFSYVYEIKHRPSLRYAVADAEWYQYHLNRDIDYRIFAPWQLGFEYLAEYGNGGKYIGPWPSDPKHAVLAALYLDGAIVYWGKEANEVREPNFENADEYAHYLAWLAALGTAGAYVGNELGKGRQPRQPVPVYNFDWLCQPLSNFAPQFELGPFVIPVMP